MVWELDDREHGVRSEREDDRGDGARAAPGKVTLTAALRGRGRERAVQPAADGAASSSEPARAQAIADRGVEQATSALPHADVIARSFGHHDVSGVRAAIGGPAADASRTLGAHAYATGDSIAFAATPDLRLAAHEAAHVVQQRAGVHLAGGVGHAGDPYERHADEVAERVVRGESAEALLDRHAGGGGGGVQRAVQRFAGGGEGGAREDAGGDESAREAGSAALAEACAEAERGDGGGDEGAAPPPDPAAMAAATAREPSATEASEIAAAAASAGGPEGAGTSTGTGTGSGSGSASGSASGSGSGTGSGTGSASGSDTGSASDSASRTGTGTGTGAGTGTGTGAGGDTAPWDSFASAFSGFPSDVRALFGGSPTGAQLAQIFTATQRDKLTAFLSDGHIPDRLFNGGDVARAPAQSQPATARQRILISGHIMTTGTYTNRQLEQQRVEARMCGHFVSLVNAYAGVGSARAHDIRGNFDYRGDVVLFTGTAGRATHSGGNLPVEQFDSIQPGDWLYIRAGINHSVVFGGWEQDHAVARRSRDGTRSIPARNATTYDQRHNGRGEGGLRHEHTPLGAEPSTRDPYVWSITRVQPPEETNVATGVEDLLPGADTLGSAADRNRAGLEQSGITIDAAKTWVRTENATLLEHVGRPRAGGDHSSRLSASQRTLIEQANAVDNLEQLVHLNERLQRLADGVDALEEGEAGGPRAYTAEHDRNEGLRAASGYDLTAGGISGDRFDSTDESATTGLLEHVRRPLAGYTPPRGGRRSRS